MDVVRYAISKPVTVTVGVILLVMFGLIGLGAIPIQLTPTVDRPQITITTEWPGRSPSEIVDEITREQEKRLKNISGLKSMRSISREGTAEITLEFYLDKDIDRAMQDVSDALRQVPDYPEEVEEPFIKAAEGAAENAIAWIIIDVKPEARHKHPDFDITTIFYAMDKEVKPYLERIDGVAEVNIYGGRDREVRVLLDPTAVAQRGLNPLSIIDALRNENRNVSGGTSAEGKRDYRIRVVGKFEREEDILDTVIAYRDGKPVYVRDVGTVEIGHVKQRGFVRSMGVPCLAMNVIRQTDANVVDVMEDLRARLDEVQANILPNLDPSVGDDLRLRQVYDETTYIESAISLVTQNLYIGGGIAALVLLLFLRSVVSTGVIALAIPISVIGTFLLLLAMGRTLNVISLAGLAFAVGMVVDNAIVVLENIYRHLQQGVRPMEAAYRGGKEVWGAILASSLTTIAVFIPVLTIQEEAGQLFRDISLAMAGAVALSLMVSITVIPTACSRWLRPPPSHEAPLLTAWHSLFGLAGLFGNVVNRFAGSVRWMMGGWRGATIRPAVILVMTAISIVGALVLMPPLDYLPAGNRNLVFGGLLIPPGLSVREQVDYAERIEAQITPYAEANINDPASVASLPPIPRGWGPNSGLAPFDPVPVGDFFIGAFQGGMFIGANSQDEQVVIPVGQLLTNAMNTIPDSFGGASQTSLFGGGVGGGNTIDLEISGPRLDRVVAAASEMMNTAVGLYTYGNVSPDPSNYNLQEQEWRIRLTRQGRELGLTTADLGTAVRALFDGAYAGEMILDGDTADIVLLPKGGRLDYREQMAEIPLATRSGRIVPADTVAEIVSGLAPQQIQRIEELPSVTLRIRPPAGRALEEVMNEIREQIIAPAEQAGLVDSTMRVRLEGTAAKLDEVNASLFGRPTGPASSTHLTLGVLAVFIVSAGALGLAGFVIWRSVNRGELKLLYGAAGAVLLGVVLALLAWTITVEPQLLTARFIWALVVTYLLMAALFESFLYPFVIMFSVPLAVVGGFAGLAMVHWYTVRDPTIAPQQLDVLTMLGFVILIGVVVNNAILIVHQALNFMRGEAETEEPPMPAHAAIERSIATRIRPIFMSTTTSVGGMLPLILFPGAGSEMYRGLGSVVVGGMLVSTMFTLVLVPLMFSLVLDMGAGLKTALRRTPPGPKPQSGRGGREPAADAPATEPEPALA